MAAEFRKDFKSEETGDLFINANTGDFEISESDAQHIQDIIAATMGSYKEFPALGVGINSYINGSNIEQILPREITIQLKSDGYLDADINNIIDGLFD